MKKKQQKPEWPEAQVGDIHDIFALSEMLTEPMGDGIPMRVTITPEIARAILRDRQEFRRLEENLRNRNAIALAVIEAHSPDLCHRLEGVFFRLSI